MTGQPQSPFEIDLEAIEALPHDKKVERLAELQQWEAIIRANPLWRFLPHEGERGYFRARSQGVFHAGARENAGQVEFLELNRKGVYMGAVVAGTRFGKTTINVADATIQTLPWDLIPPHLQPYKMLDPHKRDVRIRFVGPDLPNWLAKVMLPKVRQFVPNHALYKGEFQKAYDQRERLLRFADGSWWDFLTHDMDLLAFEGADVDRIAFDEEMVGEGGKQRFEACIGRLMDRDGDMRWTLTPIQGIGWLFNELADPEGNPRKDDEVWVVEGDIDHNPHISEKGRARALSRYQHDPAMLAARKSGRWVHREGLIFPDFRRQLEPHGHLRAARDLPRDQHGRSTVPVFEAIDPGINVDHPFAFTASWLNEDGSLETFAAHKEPNLNVAEQAALVKDFRYRFKYTPTWTVIDPAARNRNPETGRRMQDAFRKEGVYTIPGQNERALTYNEVNTRIAQRMWFVHADLDPLIGDEMSNYRWRKPRIQTDDSPAPEPIKRNDDLIDTLRYKMTRIPVWMGVRPQEEMDDSSLSAVARRHLKALRDRGGRKGALGGVWG